MISRKRILYFAGVALGLGILTFAISAAQTGIFSVAFVLLLIIVGLIIGVVSAVMNIYQKSLEKAEEQDNIPDKSLEILDLYYNDQLQDKHKQDK